MKRYSNSHKLIYGFIALAVLLNFSGLFVTIMGPDAARYATISKTMVLKHNYVELFCDGTDWLDKPHFPFWITALSFQVFGFITWAYKLPGILFLLMGAYYTYLFAKKLYNEEVALWSVLILLTAEHIILSNTDVRAEAYLTGLIIAGVYHFYRAYKEKGFWQLLIASLFAACAVMTKGIFALIPIGAAIAGELIIKRDWKNLFHIRWLIAAVLILIFILPEVYSLYVQFDMHPEKTVFDRTGVSGVKFFFWDSQFGRFFNTGPIKGEGDPFFFVHTTLWAFLPWSLLLFTAIFVYIKKNYRHVQNVEWYCICGSLLTFLVFSASKFQLPHYLNIVFPFFAIITAQYIYNLQKEAAVKRVYIIQKVLMFLLIIAPIVLQFFYRSEYLNAFTVFLLVLIIAAIFLLSYFVHLPTKQQLIYRTVLASVFLNVYLHLIFYPSLMHYQSGSEAARWINQHNPQKLPVAVFVPSYPLEFYLDQPIYYITKDSLNAPTKDFLLYASPKEATQLLNNGWKVQVVKPFQHFSVTQLDLPFINRSTRDKAVDTMTVAVVHQ